MKTLKTLIIISLLGVLSQPALAKDLKPISENDYRRQVFADDFSTPTLSTKWKLYKSSSVIRDGILVGIEQKDGGHAVVHSIKLDPFSDVQLNVDIRFEGSRATNLTFNQNRFKGSHAGHICRVVISPKKIILRDGKTGNFKNEIFEMKRSGQLDAATKALLKTKEASFPVKLKRGEWYSITIRIKGDVMQAFIDGKLVGSLRSEGIAHATKDKIGLVAPKQEMHFDNVVIKVP